MTTIPDDLLESIVFDRIGSARGRRSAHLELVILRELNEGDLDLLANPPPQGQITQPLQRLRHTHHMLARLIAEGRPGVECSMITGYCQSRISILQKDPAFQELVSYYAQQTEAKYLDVHERLAALGIDTIEELHERLHTEPGKISTRELMELAELTLDRSVAPPKGGAKAIGGGAGPVQVNINFVPPGPQVRTIELTPESPEGTEANMSLQIKP